MTERPILFSAPMVRALLAGTKTQTRRVVKKSECWPVSAVRATMLESRGTAMAVDAQRLTYGPEIKCPYGQPGDRLWVRETFCKIIGQSGGWIETDYKATYTHGDRLGDNYGVKKRWTPSIHMPRDASRVTIEITSVRVERLQDISFADAAAEGLHCTSDRLDRWSANGSSWHATPQQAYRALWEQINGPGSWEANPWVWVVGFHRIDGAAQ